MSTKLDVSKTSTVGKLHVLKPSRERNGVTSITKDNLSPTAGSRLPNSPLAVPSVVGAAPLRIPEINDYLSLLKLFHHFSPASDKPREVEASTVTEDRHAKPVDMLSEVQQSSEKGHLACNGETYAVTERPTNNGKDNSSSDAILYSEEEEARFLRSLGWEETAEEEEGLTEEEISSFYRDVSKYLNMQAASKIFKGTQPKLLIPLHSQMGKNGDISSDTKLES
ncbi:hypothetical protein Tco_0424214 [Tanacetum coccineum]